MPKPTFDINEYELRGLTPDVFTKEQRDRLNKTLSRVHGQIDWTAQLLGFNGPNYWGTSDPKADFSYNWTGLPETMNEKRQMQVGAFAVYNKDKDYSLWPSPFNRSEIKASGDFSIHVYETDGFTYLGPLGQGDEISFRYDPTIFVGASYIFDSELTFTANGSASVSNILDISTFYQDDRLWTRVYVKETSNSILVTKAGSASKPAFLVVADWEDITDWTYNDVQNQYIGLWGNKGNSLSMDFAFDSLDLHGFDETCALHLEEQGGEITVDQLLKQVGLEPTIWTPYAVQYFNFSIGEVEDLPPPPPNLIVDNGDFDDSIPPSSTIINGIYELSSPSDSDINNGEFIDIDPNAGGACGLGSPDFPIEIIEFDNGDFDNASAPTGSLNNGILDPATAPDDIADSGVYERTYADSILYPGEHEFFTCSDECSYDISIYQKSSTDSGGIESFVFKLDPIKACSVLDFPCLEWVFDPELDNGEYERAVGPTLGPWAIANDGEYDQAQICPEGVLQGLVPCEGDQFCGFVNGIYDRRTGTDVRCDENLDPIVVCDEADGGVYTIFGAPNYADCDCEADGCCLVDSSIYNLNQTPPAYLGPNLIDGGVIEPATPGGTCLTDPLRVQLVNVLDSIQWKMEPSIRNSLAPLRIWKNHVLTVTDREPGEGTDYYNFLVADENRGPEPEDSFRYFVRLPLEYPRNGKDWNRAVAVCNNQGYFSAPPKLSETEDNPRTTRPYLYDETYWRNDLEDYSVFYSEGYLSSQLREDNEPVQPGFTDSDVAFDGGTQSGLAPTLIAEYDPFSLRLPYPDGEWIGQYLVYGNNPQLTRTGFLTTDLAIGSFFADPFIVDPVWDQSAIKNPNVEFPDSNDKAALKNYVVSYAYFVCDYSAADDPVFEPGTAYNWRREEAECSQNIGGECVPSVYPTNTAYRLHQ